MPESKEQKQAVDSGRTDSSTTPTNDDASSAAMEAGESTDKSRLPPTDEAVLAYLREKGLDSAAISLTKLLKENPTTRERLELEDAEIRSQKSTLARSTGGGYGYDADAIPNIPAWGVPNVEVPGLEDKPLAERVGRDEARAFLDSFTALQLWVLTLPDDPAKLQPNVGPLDSDRKLESPKISIASLAQRVAGPLPVPEKILKDAESIQSNKGSAPWMPPSTKPELLAVTFALLVHTYCDLLEVGMETTAETLLDTFRCIYEPTYQKEIADLEKVSSTGDMTRLNQMNSTHLDSLQALRHWEVQEAQYRAKRDELGKDPSLSTDANKQRKLTEYDRNITLIQQKYEQLSKRATATFEKMQDTPFLRRARVVRWQLYLSSSSYAMLAAFLSSRDSLLPISTLLLSKCELHVERRDPLPYTPACVLDDQLPRNRQLADVNWAAPLPPAARLAESGEPVDHPAKLKQTESLPFPPLHVEEEYESTKEADKAKKAVEFNRALLINGFRRLEALERKRDYEVGFRSVDDDKQKDKAKPIVADPLKPTILLSTLCSSGSPGPVLPSTSSRYGSIDASAIWEESGIGITCAKMCPPDSRRVAAGCTDSAVRIWSMMDKAAEGDKSSDAVSEAVMVLLGHKNGFPVFDVNWNRDGRSLLSAGGDGSIRLWDTMAKGPFGTVSKATRQTTTTAPASSSTRHDAVPVPGLKPESSDDLSGAALAVYRGHAPSCPVWSVEFAASGYYFASAGADATGLIWTTDRPSPVRVLAGHSSASVNSITWHPNCNYVLTGCDDKTVRMWDVQNGRCVRLLSGCSEGINVVRVCPSGRYAAGADYLGAIHIWDLGTGKKVNELRADPHAGAKRNAAGLVKSSSAMIHSLSYSACGTALAAGGDDCAVRIWDVRGVAKPEYAEGLGPQGEDRPGTRVPSESFATRQTAILDLQYTKRNLLLSVGKYTHRLPIIAD